MRLLVALILILAAITWAGGLIAGLIALEAIAWAGGLIAGIAWYLSVTAPPNHRRKP